MAQQTLISIKSICKHMLISTTPAVHLPQLRELLSVTFLNDSTLPSHKALNQVLNQLISLHPADNLHDIVKDAMQRISFILSENGQTPSHQMLQPPPPPHPHSPQTNKAVQSLLDTQMSIAGDSSNSITKRHKVSTLPTSLADLHHHYAKLFSCSVDLIGHSLHIYDAKFKTFYELESIDGVVDGSRFKLETVTGGDFTSKLNGALSELKSSIRALRTLVPLPATTRSPSSPIAKSTAAASPNSISLNPSQPSNPISSKPPRRSLQLPCSPTPSSLDRLGENTVGVRNENKHEIPAKDSSLPPRDSPESLKPLVAATTTRRPTAALVTVLPKKPRLKLTERLAPHIKNINQLHRELATSRQILTEFVSSVKLCFQSTTEKSTKIRALLAKPQTIPACNRRTLLLNAKAKLKADVDGLNESFKSLAEIVQELKLDVIQRASTPSEAKMAYVLNECMQLNRTISELQESTSDLKPHWKKTWEEELQTIVKEQQFLKKVEDQAESLSEDQANLMDVFNHVTQLVELQASTKITRTYERPPLQDGHDGLSSVMNEISSVDVNSERRLHAIKVAQTIRQMELSSAVNEFTAELDSFVANGNLKRTGGIDEVERLRRQRNDDALKQIFRGV